MKKIGSKIKKIYNSNGHSHESYDPDRDIPYMFDIYEDDNGKKYEVNIGHVDDFEEEEQSNEELYFYK